MVRDPTGGRQRRTVASGAVMGRCEMKRLLNPSEAVCYFSRATQQGEEVVWPACRRTRDAAGLCGVSGWLWSTGSTQPQSAPPTLVGEHSRSGRVAPGDRETAAVVRP